MSMYQECSTCHRYECVCGDDLDNSPELDGTEHDHLARLDKLRGLAQFTPTPECEQYAEDLDWAVKTIHEQEARIEGLRGQGIKDCRVIAEQAEEVKRLRKALERAACECPSKSGVMSITVYNPETGEIHQERPEPVCYRCAALAGKGGRVNENSY